MNHWIIPCSPKYFDVVEHFNKSDMIVWKRSSAIEIGDVVYIYVGKPYGQIKYKCTVVDDRVNKDTLSSNSYAILSRFEDNVRYVQLKKESEYANGILLLNDLKCHGVGQVQRQARAYKTTIEYIAQFEKEV